jgi:hypothetical protein
LAIIFLQRSDAVVLFFPGGSNKTQRQLSGKLSFLFDSATSQIANVRRHPHFKNLYIESKFQILQSANTLQNASYSQSLCAGHLPSDEIFYRLNDKIISFSKGKVIVLWNLIFAFDERATHRSLCSPPEGFD